jgi:phosphopentomutase
MLKFLFVLFMTFPALACSGFNVEGKLAVDGQTWKFARKFHLGSEEKIPAGPYIISMTFTYPEIGYRVRYKIEEKKGTTLTTVTNGDDDELELGKTRDIMAKGEQGQPNSIITIKLQEN